MTRTFTIAVLAGDGIGPEVCEPCLGMLSRVADESNGFALTYDYVTAGAAAYRDTGTALTDDAIEHCRAADAILLAAMGDPSIRYPDGTEIAPQLDLRVQLGLYAGVRPVRTLPGLPPVLADRRAADLDLVLIRESTEGLFSARGNTVFEDDHTARDTMVITRPVCEKLFDFAFNVGAKRKQAGRPGHVTCVDKANVFGSLAFFRKIFDERAARFPEVAASHAYVDATSLNLLKRPWDFDVMVTENMFGDILSDIGAALMGGMGFAPSADVGDNHAVFQPCHGSAPDITGQGKANPTAMFLSAAMMLEWLGDTHANDSARAAGRRVAAAVDTAFAAGGLVPQEIGGPAGTRDVTDAVLAAL